MLDAGCGIGLLRAPLMRAFPRAQYTGLEYSEYLCQRYGWTQGSLADWRADPFDLVVCYDVLQYLDDRTAARAIANLGRLTRGVLVPVGAHGARLARKLRPHAHRSRRAPARRGHGTARGCAAASARAARDSGSGVAHR